MNPDRFHSLVTLSVCSALVLGTAPSPTFGAEPTIDGTSVELEPPPKPRPDGTRLDAFFVESGFVNLTKGGAGFLVGAHVGLGTIFVPGLDFTAGARLWSADIDRSEFGDEADGEVKNFSVHPDVRAHLFKAKNIRPFLVVGLAAQFVSADIPEDRSLEDALGGFRVGFDTGFGVASTNRNVKWRAEIRREFAEDVGNWSFTAGLGTWPIARATRAPVSPRAKRAAPITEQFAPVLDPDDSSNSGAQGGDGASGETSSAEVERLARVIRDENRAMRDEVATLQKELEAERARAAATPEPTPGPALLPASWTIPALFAFAQDGVELTDAGREDVRRVADELLARPDVRVSVEGHADSAGDALRNLTLSEQRALAVRSELIRLGVAPSRVRASGLGSTVPLSDDETEDAHRRNQRVEVRVLTR